MRIGIAEHSAEGDHGSVGGRDADDFARCEPQAGVPFAEPADHEIAGLPNAESDGGLRHAEAHFDIGIGDRLVDELRRRLGRKLRQPLCSEPPLGFFRGLVLEKAGDHKDTLDIKRGGIGAVVELARAHALSVGSPAVNTQARIQAAREAGIFGAERADDLRDAFEFISYVRLRHQAAQVRRGEPTDNFVAPGDLSSFDKRHLREAFAIVRAAQSALAHRYPMQYIS